MTEYEVKHWKEYLQEMSLPALKRFIAEQDDAAQFAHELAHFGRQIAGLKTN